MSTPATSPALIQDTSKKIFYIDRLKIVLTVFVVLHHSFITYGAPGGWDYAEKTSSSVPLILMTLFVSVNQAFFMGFLIFLSSYFIRPSYQRKGAYRFLTDRLLRLGLPLVFYSFILSPFLSYIVYYFAKGNHITYMQFLSGFHPWVDFGVLWFVAALLIFTLLYMVSRIAFKNVTVKKLKAPSAGVIILFAAGIGVISFFVRIFFPVGFVFKPLGFQFGHFSQYIALFILGLIASTSNWLNTISFQTGRKLARTALRLLLFFPLLFILQKLFYMPPEWYSGGFHWQALLYAVWEQIIGFSIITALICYGRER